MYRNTKSEICAVRPKSPKNEKRKTPHTSTQTAGIEGSSYKSPAALPPPPPASRDPQSRDRFNWQLKKITAADLPAGPGHPPHLLQLHARLPSSNLNHHFKRCTFTGSSYLRMCTAWSCDLGCFRRARFCSCRMSGRFGPAGRSAAVSSLTGGVYCNNRNPRWTL